MIAYHIGDATLTRIDDGALHLPAPVFFPNQWSEELVKRHGDWLGPPHYDAASGILSLSVHSWLIELDGRRILVDTCFGNHKRRVERPQAHMLQNPYLQKLAAVGLAPEQIDIVLCTHLHYDHVGWNTKLVDGRWVPTFPNARYVFSRIDRDHFEKVARDPTQPQIDRECFIDSVLPVLEAGQVDLIDGTCELGNGLTVEPAPGHTPGHVVMKLSQNSNGAILCGDVLHHPIQIYHPEMCSIAVVDVPLEVKTRKRLLSECAERDWLLLPAHFSHPYGAYLLNDAEGFRINLSRWPNIPHLK
jgi:glyoxylase-like metal-dependent hydrolase (beta-lactamase superfamily II)